MQGSSNNSFIPKRRDSKRQRSKPGRKIFVVTIIAYSLLFAALLSAGGTVFYKNYTTAQLENEVILLDEAVNTFSVQDFKRVQEFDETLAKARERIDNTVSVASVLDELDRITAQPIQINNLELERNGDQELLITLNFSTETLDAALFQRKILTANSALFSDVEIAELDIQSEVEAVEEGEVDLPPVVTFVGTFTTPITAALFDPAEARRTDLGVSQSMEASTIIRESELEQSTELESDLESDDNSTDDFAPLEALDVNETTI